MNTNVRLFRDYGGIENATKKAKEESKLQKVCDGLEKERIRYYSLVERLCSIGHKLEDTNIPSEVMAKEKESLPPGFITTIATEIGRISSISRDFERVLEKIEKIV